MWRRVKRIATVCFPSFIFLSSSHTFQLFIIFLFLLSSLNEKVCFNTNRLRSSALLTLLLSLYHFPLLARRSNVPSFVWFFLFCFVFHFLFPFNQFCLFAHLLPGVFYSIIIVCVSLANKYLFLAQFLHFSTLFFLSL